MSPEVCANVPPQVICQLCFTLGHTAPYYSCYFPVVAQANSPSRENAPITIQSGEANDALWYPNWAPSSHMTSKEGILSARSPYTS